MTATIAAPAPCPCFCECGRAVRFLNSSTGIWECVQCALGYHRITDDGYAPLREMPSCSECARDGMWQYATGVTAGGEPEYRCDDHPVGRDRVGIRILLLPTDPPETTPLPGCVHCARLGTTSDVRDYLPGVIYHPGYEMAHYAVIEGTRLSAEELADRVRAGVPPAELAETYRISTGAIAVALWWAAMIGPRRFRPWRTWAAEAGMHLWSCCLNIDWPPPIVTSPAS